MTTVDVSGVLCTQCGLCCDGTLFADVELSGAEAAHLEVLGIDVDDESADAGLLSQPCPALAGRRCRIYAQRPKCCRTFACALLQDVQNGAVGVEEAGARIRTAFVHIDSVRTALAEVGARGRTLPLAERCALALARDPRGVPGLERRQARLRAAKRRLERYLERHFLGRDHRGT